MRVTDLYVEIYAGEYAEVEAGDVRVYGDAEAVVFWGNANVKEGGRAIILGGQLSGEAEVEDGGQAWVCHDAAARVHSGGEAFAVIGSFVTVEPGGILHMYSKEEWPETAVLTWKDAGGRASTFYFGEEYQ